MEKVRKCFGNQRGQGTVEYLLVTAVIVAAVVFAGIKFGDEIAVFIKQISANVMKLIGK